MNDDKITFEILNAYVDGELDAADAARVACAVAENPVVARQVSALSRLRLAVAGSVEMPPLSVPTQGGVLRARIPAIAASIAFAFFIAGSVLLSGLFDRDLRAGWLAEAWRLHHGWPVAGLAAGGPAFQFADYADAVPGAYVPDLTASLLTVAHATVRPFSGGRRALVVGYRGTRGCKVSLVMFRGAQALSETIEDFHDGRNQAYAWRAGRLGYVILSDSMDTARFRELAASVRTTSRRHLPFDHETQLALRKSRDHSKPCAA
jgi:anti-sigma factor RsiW